MHATGLVDESSRELAYGDDAQPCLITDQDDVSRQRRQRLPEGCMLAREEPGIRRTEQVGQPERQALDQDTALIGGMRSQRCGEANGFLDEIPVRRAPFAMLADPLLQAGIVSGTRGGQINDFTQALTRISLGK